MKKFSTKLIILFTLALLIGLTACGDDEITSKSNPYENVPLLKDKPGEIAGLGSLNNKPLGLQFVLPEGVRLLSPIKGYIGEIKNTTSDNEVNALQTKSSSSFIFNGSGNNTKVLLLLKNDGAEKVLTFPAGLILQSKSNNYQNGILLKETSVKLDAYSESAVVLIMYGGNRSLPASNSSETYELSVVTSSTTIWGLTNALKNKKINFEEFEEKDYGTYTQQRYYLQDILWSLTDSKEGLSASQVKYIEELKNSRL